MLPLYFPRDKKEEALAFSKLPTDVGDENGETVIDERRIRIKPLPKKKTGPRIPQISDLPVSDAVVTRKLVMHISFPPLFSGSLMSIYTVTSQCVTLYALVVFLASNIYPPTG